MSTCPCARLQGFLDPGRMAGGQSLGVLHLDGTCTLRSMSQFGGLFVGLGHTSTPVHEWPSPQSSHFSQPFLTLCVPHHLSPLPDCAVPASLCSVPCVGEKSGCVQQALSTHMCPEDTARGVPMPSPFRENRHLRSLKAWCRSRTPTQ